MNSSNNILFLLANYFNEPEVCAFIEEQLLPNQNPFLKIIITDNGSNNFELLTQLSKKYPTITVLKAEKNLGYFGAAYKGLQHYLNIHGAHPQTTIICNTDMQLQNNFMSILQEIINAKTFDVAGSSIYSTLTKSYQNPYITTRIKKSKLKFLYFVSTNYYLYSLFTLYHILKNKIIDNRKGQSKQAMHPYALHGSFLIFNETFFEKGGTIDYPSILFGEEIFIAEQALQLNLNMVYEPTLQLEHAEHATTGIFKSRKTVAYLHQSYKYLLNRFFSN